MGNFRFYDIARLHGREVIIGRPFGGVGFAVGGNFARLKRFEHHAAIAEIFIADFVKIVLASVERHIFAPPVWISLERYEFARLEGIYNIGARSDGGF